MPQLEDADGRLRSQRRQRAVWPATPTPTTTTTTTPLPSGRLEARQPAPENRKERHCLSREGRGNTLGKGTALAAKAHDKGSVLPRVERPRHGLKAVEGQGRAVERQ